MEEIWGRKLGVVLNLLGMKCLSDISVETHSDNCLYRSSIQGRGSGWEYKLGIIHAERFKVTKLNESNKEGRYR